MTTAPDAATLAELACSVEATSLSPEEVVAMGVPRGTVDAWVHRGRVSPVRFGSGIRLPRDEIERLIAERRQRIHAKTVHVDSVTPRSEGDRA